MTARALQQHVVLKFSNNKNTRTRMRIIVIIKNRPAVNRYSLDYFYPGQCRDPMMFIMIFIVFPFMGGSPTILEYCFSFRLYYYYYFYYASAPSAPYCGRSNKI